MSRDSKAPLRILYEDRHCLVVSKPARLLTASDESGDDTLIAQVRAYHLGRQVEGKKGYLAPLHFLDRPVSGIVMFATSSKAAARLSEQFRTGKIEKVYNAIVTGRPVEAAADCVDHLLKDREQNTTAVVRPGTPGAKESRLAYRLLQQGARLAWLEVRPRTGRSHQIRVQLSARGMPIYGDLRYGASAAWDGRIALHAVAVAFTHPVTKERVTVEDPVPAYWKTLWNEQK